MDRDVRLPTEDQCIALAEFYGVPPVALNKERLLTKVYAEMGEKDGFDQLANQIREPGVAYLDNRSIGLMGLLDYRRLDISRQIDAKRKATLGQFFTPSDIAGFMAGMFGNVFDRNVKILDPGAGIGVLSAALVAHILKQPTLPDSIEITAFEIDPFVRSQLEVTLNVCRTQCANAGVPLSFEIIQDDFIQYSRHQFENSLFETEPKSYTHTILNPPYKKIGSRSEQRAALSSLGIETGNLYSAFTALALKWLKSKGKLVAITPRSFCNGSYFKPFRRSLSALDFCVSTGRVVDFRVKQYLQDKATDETVPLIYPGHMRDGFVEHPQGPFKKNQFVESNSETVPLFFPAGAYVVVKRFSAKEEPRRIVASVCKAKETVAFENHLNVYHLNGSGLPDRAAKGLAVFLNSSLVDMYFRLFSGHTQVNAGDLKRLNYPRMDILEKWGAVYEKTATDQEMIDDLVEAEANKMTSKKRPGKHGVFR